MKVTPAQIIAELGIERGDTLFITASMDHLGYRAPDAMALLDEVLARLGPEGTVLMPSFPFSNDTGRPAPGFVFDVRHSPSQMGLLSEMFRRLPDTTRSEHWWVPVSARGPLAAQLVAGQLGVLNPFEPGSVYHRLLDHPVKMIGLGVTTNYVAVSHVVDAELEHRYPLKVFTSEPEHGTVIGWDGQSHATRTITVTQEHRRKMKPSLLIEASPRLRSVLKNSVHDGAIIFSLPARAYYEEAVRIGHECLDRGERPPWLRAIAS